MGIFYYAYYVFTGEGIEMTKIYKATPAKKVEPMRIAGSPYVISPEALDFQNFPVMEENPVLTGSGLGGAPYRTNAGSKFSVELNILDTRSKKPIRGVLVKTDRKKGHTDRLGRVVFELPFGKNQIHVTGSGYIEDGGYAPKPTTFEPQILTVELDCDSVFTIYSSGECVPGELAHDNPGHSPINIQEFIEENWQILALASGGALGAYFLGRRKKD